jgi:hypothetical protein
MAIEDADFLPALVDSSSRMQELLNDLLANSRYFLEAQEMGLGPQGVEQRGIGGAMAALAAIEEGRNVEALSV